MQSNPAIQIIIQTIRHGKVAAAALLLVAIALALALYPRSAGADFNSSTNPTNSMGKPAGLPSLSGAAAVEHLRHQGTYQSLAEAVDSARTNAKSAMVNSLIGQQTKLTANDGAAHDYFGNAVAVSGDTAVIGAPFDDVAGTEQGSAYVFVRSGSAWTQQARLNAIDGGTNDAFGWSVAIRGNTVVIGAYGDESDRGSAYVFVRSGVTWSQQQKLTADDGVAADNFGYAIALSGETVVIGAPVEDLSTPQSKGAAYVFVRNGVTWSLQQKLVAADGIIDENFGAAVALSGETAVIGNWNKQIGANLNQGAAYVFVRSGTVWMQQQKLTAADGAADDSFGSAVALSGDTLLVGAPYDVTGANVNQGAAYVFGRSGASWNQVQKLAASDAKAQDYFGNAVAISGSTLVIGAANIAANNNQGKAYVFARNGAAWQQQEILTAADGVAGDRFGGALAMSGDTVVTGAAGDLIGANANQGSAYVFVIRDDTLAQQQRLVAADGVNNDQFGTEVALNGNTAVVSVTQDSHGNQSGLGAVYVFVRNGATWTQQAKLLAGDGAVGDYFGQALALSGDTLAVGAPEDDIGAKVDQGSVYVFVRNGAVWSQQTKLVNGLGAAGDRFGGAVALQGNTLVCGISYAQIGGMPKHGAAFVFLRNGATWNSQALLTASDGAADDLFGSAVALSGDTAVIGSPGDTVGGLPKRGSAYVFVRNGETWSQQAKLTAADGAADDGFGGTVALDGNTLVVGASEHDNGANENQGAAYIFIRNGAAWSQQQKLTGADGALGDHFGRAVALSGDTVMIGASWKDAVTVNAGSVYSFTRSGAAWTPQQQFAVGLTETRFGWSVAFDGDTVLIGAPYEPVNTLRGAAYLYAANTCPALGINPATLANGTAGASYSQSLSASGGTAPYDFTVSSGALPPGLTLSPSGLLSGTPAAGGSYNFVITATAATLCPGSRAYTLAIAGICPAITVSPANAALPAGQAGQSYNQTFTASGGAPGYNFAISAGALPNGLTLSAAGVLSGAPIAFGNFSFTVKATDSNGCIGMRAYTLTIASPCTVTINPASFPAGTTGVAFNQQFAGSGGVAPYTYSLIVGEFPTGLSINAAGVLSGTPTQSGIFDFTVKATDSNGCIGTRGYTMTIHNGGGNSGLQFYPLSRPVRILDTRAGQGNCDNVSTPINGGTSLTTFARLTCEGISIPANAQAVVGNLTIINQTAQTGYLTIFPDGQAAPLTANMIYEPGGILANNFTVGLGANGNFNIFGERTIDAIVDISGYYAPPAAGGLYYHPLSKPVRLLDTRPGQGNCDNVDAPIAAGTSLTTLARSTCESLAIPSTAQAIAGNATVINGSGQTGYLTIYPNDVAAPLAANIVYFPGQILANAFTVSLSAGGEFNIFAERQIDMVIDVAGYYSNEAVDANGQGLLFTPLATPVRLLDTRAGEGNCDSVNAPIAAGTSLAKMARMTCEGQLIPNNAQAVIGNVTVINQTAQAGYLTMYPTGQAAPLAANMIYQPGQILSNAFVVGLSAAGQFNLFAERTLDAIVDVSGFFAP